MKNLYTIGEVATIFQETTETFRHYDRVGLLKAHLIKENGYRYYSLDQFEMIRTILYLRTIGTPINTIKDILNSKDRDSITNELIMQTENLSKQITHLTFLNNQTKILLRLLEEFNSNEVQLKEEPELYIIDQSFASNELSLETEHLKHLREGIDINWVKFSNIISLLHETSLRQGQYHAYTKYGLISEEPLNTDSTFFKILPSQLYVTACLRIDSFSHYEIEDLYKKMLTFIEDNNLKINNLIFERNILDLYNDNGSGDIHYIKVYIPVERL